MDRNQQIWGPGNHKLVENPSFKLPEHIFKPNPKVQLADAQVLELDAHLAYRRARADLRAAIGHDAASRNP
jgi:hypothetical protein